MPFYFINLLPTSFLDISILLAVGTAWEICAELVYINVHAVLRLGSICRAAPQGAYVEALQTPLYDTCDDLQPSRGLSTTIRRL